MTMEPLLTLPLWYQLSLVGLLGLVIGSFLNVFIYRFHTGKSLAGSSHCLSCGTPLRWFELLPVVSYLALRGRCRSCGSFIPARYLLVEVLTASLFVTIYLLTPFGLSLPLEWVLVSALVVITVYDMYHLIIPNALVAWVGLLSISLLYLANPEPSSLLPHVLAAMAVTFFFAGLWAVSRGRWIGLGDAKLAFPLALLLDPWATFSFVVLSFWVGALLSLTWLGIQYLLQRGKQWLPIRPLAITIKSEVPFAPFIILAFLLCHYLGIDVLSLIDFVV